MRYVFFLFLVAILTACAVTQTTADKEDTSLARASMPPPIVESRRPPLEVPDFTPVQDDVSPLHRGIVSISARNTPLRDVLYTIAETASLNLVIDRGVNPDLPLTMTFRDLGIEDALDIVFDSVDYFYEIKNNILIARATGTATFELGRPNIVQDYSVDVGGDILSGTTSGGEGSNAISGDVSMKSTSDANAFQFWDAVENTIATLLSSGPGGNDKQTSRFIVNRMAGTVMVTGSKRDIHNVGIYVNNLKAVLNRQVLIEARIVEVQLSEGLKYGIDWEALGRWLNEDFIHFQARGFTDMFTAGKPSFDVTIFDAGDFAFLLRALQEQGDVKTLSNPRVNILNGQTSLLSVGRNTTFVSSIESDITSSDGSSPIVTFTVKTDSILSGIMFGLVPYIDSSGEVTLTITPIISNLVDLEPVSIGTEGSQNAVEIKLPVVDLREMSTTVKVMDGQLVVIGGLIDRKEISREDKIPLLGDIPLLGNAFRSVEKTHENAELVIMLIPRIIS